MNNWLLSAKIMLTLSFSVSAQNSIFNQAQSAYDSGEYAQAVVLYEQLLNNGISNSEVHYNLANAAFKEGNLSTAVRHYRMAWHDSPRDPDIRANLRFALNDAGAVEPSSGFQKHVFTALSANEWVIVFVSGYITLSLLLLLALFFNKLRPLLLKLCFGVLAVILFSAAGWRHWHLLKNHRPEWVVAKMGATALYGPVEGSTAHYKLPVGALVRRQGMVDSKGWIEVEYDEKRGWVKPEYLIRVFP